MIKVTTYALVMMTIGCGQMFANKTFIPPHSPVYANSATYDAQSDLQVINLVSGNEDGQSSPLTSISTPANPFVGAQPLSSSCAESHPLSDDSSYTAWETLAGDWKYKSLYTGKTYDSTLRLRKLIQNPDAYRGEYCQIEVTNEIFDKAIILYRPAAGYVSFFNQDTPDHPYPKVGNYTNEGDQVYVSTTINPLGNAPVNLFQYLASGVIHLPNLYFTYADDNSGNMEYIYSSVYDYLYDASAPDAKISADFPRLSNGQSSVHVNLTVGSAVDEVYYAVVVEPRDESQIDSEGIEDFDPKQYGWAYDFENITRYVKEFAANGTTNSHLILGKVASGVSGFDVPLTWEGVRAMAIVAFKNGEVTDMVYDYIENRTNTGWQSVNQNLITFSGSWAIPTFPNIVYDYEGEFNINKLGDLQYNPTTKQYRYIGAMGVGNEYDRVYVDAEFGNDKVYIDQSYTPFEITYRYTNHKGETVTGKQRQILQSITAYNVNVSGFDKETIMKEFGYGTPFSENSYHAESTFMLPTTTLIMDRWLSSIFNAGGGFVDFSATTPGYVKAEISKTNMITFECSRDIDYIEYNFAYSNGEDEPRNRYRYTPANSDTPSLYGYALQGRLTKDMTKLHYRAYNQSGVLVADELIDIPVLDLAEFEVEIIPGEGCADWAPAGNRTAVLGTNTSETLSFAIKNFSIGIDNAIHPMAIDKQSLSATLEPTYIGTFSFTGLGDGQVYVEDASWSHGLNTSVMDNKVVVPKMCWSIRQNGVQSGYYAATGALEIRLPQNILDMLSGVEEVRVDTDVQPAEYYNLQGMRIARPAKGSIVIERKGGLSRKIRF